MHVQGEHLVAADIMTHDQYVDFVHEQFEEARSGQLVVFSNRGVFHAGVVMSEMISRAACSLDIVSGSLREGVYDAEIIREACQRLSGKIRVIVTDDVPLSGPSALRHLSREVETSRIEVRAHAPGFSQGVRHFALSDGRHLRSEQDQRERSAIIVLNAHESDLADGYKQLFEKRWTAAKSLAFAEVCAA